MQNRKNSKGFTLIGAVIIIVLIAIVVPSLLIPVYQATRDLGNMEQTELATMLAQDLMEEIKSKKWDHNTPDTGGIISDANKTATLGPEGSEVRGGTGSSSFNDVDDYNGLNNKPPQDPSGNVINEYSNFRVRAFVTYVQQSDLDTAYTGSPRPNYKRVRVIVSWDNDQKSIDLITIFGNF